MKLTDTLEDQDIRSISDSIIKARIACSGLSEYPGELPQSLETAYRIQDLSMSKWRDRLVGWKVGGIAPHLQDKFKQERLSGPIYASNVEYSPASEVIAMPVFEDGFAAIEAEFILELGDTSGLPDKDITERQIVDVIEKVYIGVEIASSPIQNINDFGPVAPISDFGNNSGMVIGAQIENWQQLDFSTVAVTVDIDGRLYGPTRTKPGLDGPLGAAKFLIEQLKLRGYAIPVGTYICSGAITGVHDSEVGAKSTISFEGLGTIDLTLVSNRNW